MRQKGRYKGNKNKPTRPKYSSINDETMKLEGGVSPVDVYFIDFKKIHTKELIILMRNLTIHSRWIGDIRRKPVDSEREFYFKNLESLIGVKFTDMSPTQQRVNYFLDNILNIETEIRKVLATREHIPSGKEAKEIRRKKSQGRYFVD